MANLTGEEAPRRRGRPKGSRNAASRDVRAATRRKGTAALKELWKLCTDAEDEKVRKAALDTWLAYAYGRPVDRQELTGKDGAPLHPASDMTDGELADLLLHQLVRGELTDPRLPPDMTRRVAFTYARAERGLAARAPARAPEAVTSEEEVTPAPAMPEPEPEPDNVVWLDDQGRPATYRNGAPRKDRPGDAPEQAYRPLDGPTPRVLTRRPE